MSVTIQLFDVDDFDFTEDLSRVGETIVNEMQSKVNKRTGGLAKSITHEATKTKLTIGARGKHARALHLIEHGTAQRRRRGGKGATGSMPAHPFFRTTIRQYEKAVDEVIAKGIERSVKLK